MVTNGILDPASASSLRMCLHCDKFSYSGRISLSHCRTVHHNLQDDTPYRAPSVSDYMMWSVIFIFHAKFIE